MTNLNGRKAEVINPGSFYTTYRSFAEKFGYPDAAVERDSIPSMRTPRKGSVVTLLTCGRHLTDASRILWIVETEKDERFIISEEGLRILDEEVTGVTVLKDESLGGIEREYREVKRKADVGERIKIVAAQYDYLGATWGYDNGEVHTVISSDGNHEVNIRPDGTEDSEIYVESSEYVTLEQTDNLHINGERFRMVDRKAAVGDRVIMVGADCRYYKAGNTAEVKSVSDLDIYADLRENADHYGDGKWYVAQSNYRVLEPLTSADPSPLLSAQPAEVQTAHAIVTISGDVARLNGRLSTVEAKLDETARKLARAEARIIELTERKITSDPVEATPPTIEVHNVARSAQETRDDIVKRAKVDVADLREIGERQGRKLPMSNPLYNDYFKVEFVINAEKRTVVSLLRPKYGELFHLETGTFRVIKGIAKCAPGDVFNSHIGRAIALRRALGLVVPAEYFEAPNPTEARIGDFVTTYGYLEFTVTQEFSVHDVTRLMALGSASIIDDSRESDSAEPRKEVA